MYLLPLLGDESLCDDSFRDMSFTLPGVDAVSLDVLTLTDFGVVAVVVGDVTSGVELNAAFSDALMVALFNDAGAVGDARSPLPALLSGLMVMTVLGPDRSTLVGEEAAVVDGTGVIFIALIGATVPAGL